MIASFLNFLHQITDFLISSPELSDLVDVSSSGAIKILDVKLVNWEDLGTMFLRFMFNLVVSVIIIRGLYYAKAKRKDYLFTYLLINLVVFVLCITLSSVKLQLGFAFGLFAIFGIIRYRTDAIPIKEMTYLFVIIGIAVINALTNKKVSYLELFFANGVIVIALYVLENLWLLRHESRKPILYERIDLIKPDKRKELIIDLERRTGLKITRVEVGRIDFMRDVAKLNIFYYEDEVNSADYESNFGDSDD